MKVVKGIIFDMDGLLFDTERIYYESTQEVADRYGIPYDEALYHRFLGVSDEEMWRQYHRLFASYGKETVQTFIDESYARTIQRFQLGEAETKPGVHELLDFLEEQQIPRLVASSNVQPVIETLLEKAGLREKFQGIVSAEDVHFAKPDPEIFTIARSKLGIPAEQTLILEDSENGILAAEGAAIPVIMVPDLMPPTDRLREKTVAVLDSLHEVIDYLRT